jgi:hypothetical protein
MASLAQAGPTSWLHRELVTGSVDVVAPTLTLPVISVVCGWPQGTAAPVALWQVPTGPRRHHRGRYPSPGPTRLETAETKLKPLVTRSPVTTRPHTDNVGSETVVGLIGGPSVQWVVSSRLNVTFCVEGLLRTCSILGQTTVGCGYTQILFCPGPVRSTAARRFQSVPAR